MLSSTHQPQVINDVPDALVLCRTVASISHSQGIADVPRTNLTPEALGQLLTDINAPAEKS